MTKERETHLNMVCEDRSTWIVFTDDPTMIRLFESKAYPKGKAIGLGFEFSIPANKLSFKTLNKTTRKLSVEEREQRKLRLAHARSKKINKSREKMG